MNSPSLFDWQSERDAAMATVERNAGQDFAKQAREHVLAQLAKSKEMSSEDVATLGEMKGIIPHDSRAWGPVMAALVRAGLIVRTGYAPRRRGHGSPGPVWRLA